MSEEKCECVSCCDSCSDAGPKSKRFRPKLFQRIRYFFLNLFHSRHNSKKSSNWIDNEVRLAIANEKSGQVEDGDEIFTKYAISCIKAAAKIAKQFSKQGHSGMSAEITLDLIRKLCSFTPLTALTGEDDEWDTREDREVIRCSTIIQNKRNYSVFKELSGKDNTLIGYTYNRILDIVNEDDVWLKYPPVDDPGTLDDDDENVQLYFAEARKLKDKLNSEIKFPYVPVTHYYKWNFETKQLDKIEE